MVTLPFLQNFGRSSIVFRWAIHSIYIAPYLALWGVSQGENT